MNHEEKVKVSVVKAKKIAISTTGIKSVNIKLLTTSTKIVLMRGKQDISVKKI